MQEGDGHGGRWQVEKQAPGDPGSCISCSSYLFLYVIAFFCCNKKELFPESELNNNPQHLTMGAEVLSCN